MLNCCVVLISALLPRRIARNRIKSYWNAAALIVEWALRISKSQILVVSMHDESLYAERVLHVGAAPAVIS
jgi:hypothetical protein